MVREGYLLSTHSFKPPSPPLRLKINDKTAYKLFHDIDFNKFPFNLLQPLKTRLYPITSLFVVETPYAKFYLDDMVKVTSIDEYCLDDLRPNDIVLDIGACIGSFSLKVYKKVKKVYAIEPIMTLRLLKNIKLNKAENKIIIYKGGLSNISYRFQVISWSGYSEEIVVNTLSDFITICGGHVDFLKLDCEGAEWCIKPEEFKGIRRIEAEIHRTKEHECGEFLNTLAKAGFVYKSEYIVDGELMIVHAYRS